MEFRRIRRKDKELFETDAHRILDCGSYGVLSVLGDYDYPYGIPLNYVWDGNKIYFHSALEGHKLDAIRRHPNVSFCVVGQEIVQPQKLTTFYQSAVVFGTAQEVTDLKEIQYALTLLCKKYAPDFPEESKEEQRRYQDTVCIVSISPDHLSAKGLKDIQ
jgi:nitroimidazol reductase NimA-like FMN-containing flavoprotein (pyridoxamine 5'-phosphate oxidase superfamily)